MYESEIVADETESFVVDGVGHSIGIPVEGYEPPFRSDGFHNAALVASASEGHIHIYAVGFDGQAVDTLSQQDWHVIAVCCQYFLVTYHLVLCVLIAMNNLL